MDCTLCKRTSRNVMNVRHLGTVHLKPGREGTSERVACYIYFDPLKELWKIFDPPNTLLEKL